MKIPKCSKTATGKHHWLVDEDCPMYGSLKECQKAPCCPEHGHLYYNIPTCKYCGMVDDKKLKVKK